MNDELRKLRTKERRDFWGRFRFSAIEEFYKQRLYDLFENRCFKCGGTSRLQIDHHISILLGGHLVPGNLVVLCSFCNGKKKDLSPENFYTSQELESLKSILGQESALFNFPWDFEFWQRDRKGFLLHIGLNSELVDEILSNPNHRLYIEPQESISVTISADLSTFTFKHNNTEPR